jgi:Ca2+-binding RTX toxin-like protein
MPAGHRSHLAVATLALALLASAALSAAAQGATFGASGGTLTYTAYPGETNKLEIRSYNGVDPGDEDVCNTCGLGGISYGDDSGPFIQIDERGSTLQWDGHGHCAHPAGKPWECNIADVKHVVVNLGDHNDTLELMLESPIDATVDGNDGNDVLTGGNSDDTIHGGNGADTIYGEGTGGGFGPFFHFAGSSKDAISGDAGPDRIFGGDGNDTIDGGSGDDDLSGEDGFDSLRPGTGRDDLSGGGGRDTVRYDERSAPVLVNLGAGTTLNGEVGEGDRVAGDIERVYGGSAGDRLVGNDASNDIFGGPGSDVIAGGDGDDSLFGLDGNDTLDGGDGSNLLDGGNQDDSLAGGLGPDTFDGGAGVDTASYAGRSVGVAVSIDTIANDGRPGEGDRVGLDVENIDGSLGADTLVGNSAANRIQGFGGGDTIDGGKGADNLGGGPGDDWLISLDSSKDADTCGPGADEVFPDKLDVVAADCEKHGIFVVVVLPPPPKPKPGAGMRLEIPCAAGPGRCIGTLTVRGRGIHVARHLAVRAGTRARLRVRLPRAMLRALRHGKRRRVVVKLRMHKGSGRARTQRRTVVLGRAAKPRRR